MTKWVGVHGYEIEAIVLNGRQRLRVRLYGYLVAYCMSVAEVARHVDLADLVEVVELSP
ncbi:transposase [Planotetraspora mira]|uniref:Transposase n=1 Tax=Planotetraspora mira TaxID=58121 RepID=A0A8J3XB48_9ACTN|nr:transposase [Planotetraspora mira]GII34640.1 hypothetical protein Pmi06nite_80820 [Planotetraspora mira]